MVDRLRVRQAGKLRFFGEHVALADAKAFKAWLAPLRNCEWVAYAKRPFGGPQAVLAYLSRYTHRVAISNSRLIALDEHGVTFKWKDYRVKNGSKGRTRHKTMTLEPGEFMRRFLLLVLPGGIHRMRHYGLLGNGSRKASLSLAREFLNASAVAAMPADGGDLTTPPPTFVCWHCGCAMLILQTFTRGHGPAIRAPPSVHTQ